MEHVGAGDTDHGESLQDRYAPQTRCFGCGPANDRGLRIKSFPEGDEVVARWRAEPHHEAFEGVINGGVIGALFDCHLNWTAAHHLMTRDHTDKVPCTVTARFSVSFKRPTPSAEPVELRARVVDSGPDRVTVEGTMTSGQRVTATAEGIFVAVQEGHPAYFRW